MSTMLEDLDRIVKIAAVFLGAAWGYFKFVKGRTLRKKLVTRVSAEIRRGGDRTYVVVHVALTNLGMTEIRFDHASCRGFLFLECGKGGATQWTPVGEFSILADHETIEPSEEIEEQRLLPLPDVPRTALKATVYVASRSRKGERSPAWSGEALAIGLKERGGEAHGPEDGGGGAKGNP